MQPALPGESQGVGVSSQSISGQAGLQSPAGPKMQAARSGDDSDHVVHLIFRVDAGALRAAGKIVLETSSHVLGGLGQRMVLRQSRSYGGNFVGLMHEASYLRSREDREDRAPVLTAFPAMATAEAVSVPYLGFSVC